MYGFADLPPSLWKISPVLAGSFIYNVFSKARLCVVGFLPECSVFLSYEFIPLSAAACSHVACLSENEY